MRPLIYIVDRDLSFSLLAVEECERRGYSACGFTIAGEALPRAEMERPSLFIVNADEQAPDGAKLYEAVLHNKKLHQPPVIVVSDCGSEEQCVSCLERGADDYLTKPVNYRELVLRARAVLYSVVASWPLPIRIGALEIDIVGMTASIAGKSISLTTMEYKLLEYLARNSGRPVARPELLSELWAGEKADIRTVDSHVWRLRKKIEPEPTAPIYLHTVLNVGYCLGLSYPGADNCRTTDYHVA